MCDNKELRRIEMYLTENFGVSKDRMAFAIQMYRQDLAKKFTKASKSDHLGIVGQKIQSTVLVTKDIPLEGAWGTTHLYIMKDEDGNIIKWFSSRSVLTEGYKYEIDARVKAHDEYNGTKGTVITRAKAQEIGVIA